MVNSQNIQGTGTAVKFLGIVRSKKTCVVPKTVIDKMQAYLIPKNGKEVQVLVGVMGFWRTFIFHLAKCLCPLYCQVKKGYIWDWGSEQQAALGKTKILVKQIKALGTSSSRATI